MIDTDKYEGHTEGPWKWENDTGTIEHDILGNGDSEIFAVSKRIGIDFKVSNADKQLIADAPDLLAMLNELLEECRMHYWCYESENDDDVCARCGGNNEHKEWCDL